MDFPDIFVFGMGLVASGKTWDFWAQGHVAALRRGDGVNGLRDSLHVAWIQAGDADAPVLGQEDGVVIGQALHLARWAPPRNSEERQENQLKKGRGVCFSKGKYLAASFSDY